MGSAGSYQKHPKSAKLPWHHNNELSFLSLLFLLFKKIFLAVPAALYLPWLLTDYSGCTTFKTKPDQTYLTNLPDIIPWPTWPTYPPTWPYHPPNLPTNMIYLSPTRPYNLPVPTDNLPKPTDTLPTPQITFHSCFELRAFQTKPTRPTCK